MIKPDWTPADVSNPIDNPFYAINIDPTLAGPHPPLISEEQWIAANVTQIENLGPQAYLRNLLSISRATTENTMIPTRGRRSRQGTFR